MQARGFSLVEVLVALFIIALSATFVALGFERLVDNRLDEQARKLSGWLQSFSDTAVLRGGVYGAWYDVDKQRFAPGYYFAGRWRRVTGEQYNELTLADDFALFAWRGNRFSRLSDDEKNAQDTPHVLFFPSGQVLPGRFQLRDQAAKRQALIEPATDGVYAWHIAP